MVLLGGTLEEKSGVGLGCMSVSGQYNNGVPLDEKAAFAFFKGVYDAGCRHYDTAEVYKSGPPMAPAGPDTVYNETQLGQFLRTVPRDSYTVATKYQPYIRRGRPCDYKNVRESLLASLQRLGLSYVDLYYTHRVPTKEAGVEFVRSAQRLKEEGLLKNIGLSEVSADWLRAAHAAHPVCCIQQEWSLLTRDIEHSVVPTCRELGVGIVAYSPLARNLLAAPKERPVDRRRENIPRFKPENWEKNRRMGEELEALASRKGVTPAQLGLAWLAQKARDLNVSLLPIPGTAKLAHQRDNIASVGVALSPADMELVEAVGRMAAGNRESDAYMAGGVEGQQAKL